MKRQSRQPGAVARCLPSADLALPSLHVAPSSRAGTEAQKQMTLKEAISMYPAAIGWSVLLSTAM